MRRSSSFATILAAGGVLALAAALRPAPATGIEPYPLAVVWVTPGDPAGVDVTGTTPGAGRKKDLPVLPAQRARPPASRQRTPAARTAGRTAGECPQQQSRALAGETSFRRVEYRETAFGRVEVTRVGI